VAGAYEPPLAPGPSRPETVSARKAERRYRSRSAVRLSIGRSNRRGSQSMARVDVKRSFEIGPLYAAVGRIAPYRVGSERTRVRVIAAIPV
jgi:hypothetical protein